MKLGTGENFSSRKSSSPNGVPTLSAPAPSASASAVRELVEAAEKLFLTGAALQEERKKKVALPELGEALAGVDFALALVEIEGAIARVREQL